MLVLLGVQHSVCLCCVFVLRFGVLTLFSRVVIFRQTLGFAMFWFATRSNRRSSRRAISAFTYMTSSSHYARTLSEFTELVATSRSLTLLR